jgi:hypothetical protein
MCGHPLFGGFAFSQRTGCAYEPSRNSKADEFPMYFEGVRLLEPTWKSSARHKKMSENSTSAGLGA